MTGTISGANGQKDEPFKDPGFTNNIDLFLGGSTERSFVALYPQYLFAFSDPDLQQLFSPLDKAALKAKTRARHWGLTAVGLLSVALIAAAFDILFHSQEWFNWVIILAGMAGILGVVIGFAGVMTAGAKQEWLRQRYICERIRQVHFQTLVRWAPMIIEAARSGDKTKFLAERAKRNATFRARVVGAAKANLANIVSDNDTDGPWLVDDVPGPIPPGPDSEAYFDALDELRIRHQLDYARMQLTPDARLIPRTPIERARLLSGVATFCVVAILVLHFAAIAGAVKILNEESKAWIHVLTLSLAVAALAARTIEEGLQAHHEVERYRAYSSALRIVRDRFKNARTDEEKRDALQELEEVSFEEMVNFLKSHHEARFVM